MPARICDSRICASADNSRMVISVLDISKEKITDVSRCFTDALRATSRARVLLWVGTIDRPAR